MEHAHRQALAELQRQHDRQMKELGVEKDRLLEEETLATARGQLTTVCLFICSFIHFKLCCRVVCPTVHLFGVLLSVMSQEHVCKCGASVYLDVLGLLLLGLIFRLTSDIHMKFSKKIIKMY